MPLASSTVSFLVQCLYHSRKEQIKVLIACEEEHPERYFSSYCTPRPFNTYTPPNPFLNSPLH
jgi:hypothetical protein